MGEMALERLLASNEGMSHVLSLVASELRSRPCDLVVDDETGAALASLIPYRALFGPAASFVLELAFSPVLLALVLTVTAMVAAHLLPLIRNIEAVCTGASVWACGSTAVDVLHILP